MTSGADHQCVQDVTTSRQRRAIGASTRLVWIVVKRCEAAAQRVVELKGPTIFRKLVDSCTGSTRILALRILKVMISEPDTPSSQTCCFSLLCPEGDYATGWKEVEAEQHGACFCHL